MTEVAWRPTPEYIENANVTRLMRAHGVGSIDELRQRSIDDMEWFWDAVVKDMGIEFTTPYERVMDDSGGIEWTKWFVGGRVNFTYNCVDRHALGERADHVAIIGEREDGGVTKLTYAELKREVDAIAAGLRELGIGKGDPVAVFMPMVAEAVIAAYADRQARRDLHADLLRLRAARGRRAAAGRQRQGDHHRRRRPAPRHAGADEAGRRRGGRRVAVGRARDRARAARAPTCRWSSGRDIAWAALRERGLAAAPDGIDCEDTDAEDLLMIAYTSGTTGKPKGAVHVHGGFLVKMASEVVYQVDLHPDDTLYWVTDMGWIMGPWEMVGAGAIGATVVLYEGAPDWPAARSRLGLGRAARGHVLGVSPTLIRALKTQGDEQVTKHDLSSLRILGSTGEPWNPEPYMWLSRRGRRGPRADHQHLRRHRGRRLLPDALPGRGDQGLLARRRRRSGWTSTSSTTRASRCAARSASWSARGPGRA